MEQLTSENERIRKSIIENLKVMLEIMTFLKNKLLVLKSESQQMKL